MMTPFVLRISLSEVHGVWCCPLSRSWTTKRKKYDFAKSQFGKLKFIWACLQAIIGEVGKILLLRLGHRFYIFTRTGDFADHPQDGNPQQGAPISFPDSPTLPWSLLETQVTVWLGEVADSTGFSLCQSSSLCPIHSDRGKFQPHHCSLHFTVFTMFPLNMMGFLSGTLWQISPSPKT